MKCRATLETWGGERQGWAGEGGWRAGLGLARAVRLHVALPGRSGQVVGVYLH